MLRLALWICDIFVRDMLAPPRRPLSFIIVPSMAFERAAGILLHPTSLPARGGIGDFGPAAYEFLDFLAAARQGLWQVLPLGPPAKGASPYSSTSAFAGNSLLISLE